ncbi:sigma 54-interacting transcriptional regulator [Clostridium scatologenes]|uniref:Putative sigma-54 specific transcriptional regulator n=1 Tax=Clostridium scatologenes TaxID=1548 RepID=A0A0E3M663_CLOSL|nr:sigma 54-interacting transcriptional regulator [Clostridium scatologenes]AKA69238.1 putative sigma-54 specific transcriptional regulator [Clostridium scatologenes]
MNYKDLINNDVIKDVLDNCNDGINIVDVNGKLIFANNISASYVNTQPEHMIGKMITDFYPKAVLLSVLKNKHSIHDKKIHQVGNKKYMVNSFPIFINNEFSGAYSVFKSVNDIDALNKKIKSLELQLALSSVESDPMSIIGKDDSLEKVLKSAKRTVGSLAGPRHSIIIGESGTGKTMLAKMIHSYAIRLGILDKNAPFVEINCAQYTNSDIAAVEIFGSEQGAYTGSKQKKGLFEQASGGILFLDEAHALDHYQNLLLKAIESGKIRRVGGSKEISVDVIIIAASTKNLKDELLPELYQRLAQYELTLPSLSDRSLDEKLDLINHFVKKYEDAVMLHNNIKYKVILNPSCQKVLLKAHYPRNIRQLRDVINLSIDAASPLISEIHDGEEIITQVELDHLPFELFDESTFNKHNSMEVNIINNHIANIIDELNHQGLGPRKISKKLKEKGYSIEYYKVAYYLKKMGCGTKKLV